MKDKIITVCEAGLINKDDFLWSCNVYGCLDTPKITITAGGGCYIKNRGCVNLQKITLCVEHAKQLVNSLEKVIVDSSLKESVNETFEQRQKICDEVSDKLRIYRDGDSND